MFKKLFLLFSILPFAAGAANLANGRPSVAGAAMARAPTVVSASGLTLGVKSGNKANTSNAADARCANPLPAQITNARCIQKYMACLKMDTVCGEHFEACGTEKLFGEKKIMCSERLLECSDEGINAIYGTSISSTTADAICDGEVKLVERTFGNFPDGSSNISDLKYKAGGMLDTAIKDGAAWVAVNAVTACISLADGCIKRACQNSGFKCLLGISDISTTTVVEKVVDAVTGNITETTTITSVTGSNHSTGTRIDPQYVKNYLKNTNYTDDKVKAYIKGACDAEIGTSDACYMFTEGSKPTSDAWKQDAIEQKMVAEDVLFGTGGRFAANQNKILEWTANSVVASLDNCKGAARNCITNTCGSGSLAACYGSSHNSTTGAINIAQNDFSGVCTGVVNNNQNCKDFMLDDNSLVLGQTDTTIWNILWGIGSVANGNFAPGALSLVPELNEELSLMFNETTVRNLYLQCRNETESCIRRECGTGFKNCYINDPLAVAMNTGNGDSYGASSINGTTGIAAAAQNAAGGFDEYMAKGLCVIPVKRSDSCQSYFDIEYAKNNSKFSSNSSWGGFSSAWNTAGVSGFNGINSVSTSGGWSGTGLDKTGNRIAATSTCTSANTYSVSTNTQTYCSTADVADGSATTNAATCAGKVAGDVVVNESYSDGSDAAFLSQCAAQESAIFGQLMADIAVTARTQLTKEQNQIKNVCEQHRGQSSFADTYMWMDRPEYNGTCIGAEYCIPDNYTTMGINGARGKSPTTNLWGAFCQVKVSLGSTDDMLLRAFQEKTINGKVMTSNVDAYFSLGDTVMCGSWLKQSDLDNVQGAIASGASADLNWAQRNVGLTTTLATLGGIIGGGVGGAFAGNALMKKFAPDNDIQEVDPTTINTQISKANECRGKIVELIKQGMKKDITLSDGTANVCDGYYGIPGYLGISVFTVAAGTAAAGTVATTEAAKKICADFGIAENATDCTADGYAKNSTILERLRKNAEDIDGRVEGMQKALNNNGQVGMKDSNKNLWWTGVGAGLGAAALGTGAGVITNLALKDSITKAESDADKKAIQEWFDNVGAKIQCTIGGKVVGSYGDMIELK